VSGLEHVRDDRHRRRAFFKAANVAGPLDHSAVVNQGLKALIQRDSATPTRKDETLT
jgi:hypothetical protein